ncbi:hypothetical protein PVAG01_04179 [Phlyctema vagabunda]|uniref:Uncharacterized protein n=1 Tax=Phlyctema vagabunda TaxID=108571 RepID=A0ABR4PNW0_9HELO
MAPLLLHLNYPSFTTQRRHNGEVMDQSNPCLRTLMESGFDDQNAMWLDSFCRREYKPKKNGKVAQWVAKDHYSEEIYDMHLSWAETVRSTSRAKVEVIFGKHSREIFTEKMKYRLDILKLWTQPPVEIYVEYEDRGKSRAIRLILFAKHPEFYLHNWEFKYAAEMDPTLTTAANLAGVELNCTFFQQRVDYANDVMQGDDYNGESEKKMELEGGTRKKAKLVEPAQIPYSTKSMFNKSEKSPNITTAASASTINTELAVANITQSLIRYDGTTTRRKQRKGPLATIEDMIALEASGSVFAFEELPPNILEWLQKDLGISNQDELRRSHRLQCLNVDKGDLESIKNELKKVSTSEHQRCRHKTARTKVREDLLLASDMILDIGFPSMVEKLYRNYISSEMLRSAEVHSAEEYLIRKPGLFMEVKCQQCGRVRTDSSVRYWKTYPQYYVAYYSDRCPSLACFGHERYLIPVDPKVDWVKGRDDFLRCKSTQKKRKSRLDDYFEYSYGDLPTEVEVHCAGCKGSKCIDDAPRWSAHNPPRFLVPIWTCAVCKKSKNFFPVQGKNYICRSVADRAMKEGSLPPKRGHDKIST